MSGEQPLAGVRIVVGPIWSTSDSSGRYRAWDLLPYEPTIVAVDSSTLASPLWVPAFAAASVEPSPNRYRTLDIPVLPGGVVEGRVTGQAMGGITLRLKHKASGEQRILTTFSDGTFYGIGIRPGDWELTVDPKCLEVLKAAAEPVTFTMVLKRRGWCGRRSRGSALLRHRPVSKQPRIARGCSNPGGEPRVCETGRCYNWPQVGPAGFSSSQSLSRKYRPSHS